MNEKLNFNVFFSKMGFFSKIVLIVQIFKKNVRIFKKMYGLVQKNVRIVRIFFKKIVRIVFRKLYGLYGFLLKMYGFLYGWVQKSFGHPVVTC